MSLKKEMLQNVLEDIHIPQLARGFVESNVHPHASIEQAQDMNMAFMTGAYVIWCLMDRVKPETKERSDQLWNQWGTELEMWYAKMELEFGSTRQ